MTYLIFDFRLETMLPRSWVKTILDIAGRFFYSKKEDASLHSQDSMHNESDVFHYAKKLEKMPQRELIKRILYLEEKT